MQLLSKARVTSPSDPTLCDLGHNFTRIRGAQKRELCLELRKTMDESTLNWKNVVGKSLSEERTVRQLTDEITVEF